MAECKEISGTACPDPFVGYTDKNEYSKLFS
jgi:hypothetical protein